MKLFAIVRLCIGGGLNDQDSDILLTIADSQPLKICCTADFAGSDFDRSGQRQQLCWSGCLTLQ